MGERSSAWQRRSKESGPKGPGFALPPEGTSILIPPLRQSAGV